MKSKPDLKIQQNYDQKLAMLTQMWGALAPETKMEIIKRIRAEADAVIAEGEDGDVTYLAAMRFAELGFMHVGLTAHEQWDEEAQDGQ